MLLATPTRDGRGALQGLQLAGERGREFHERTGHFPPESPIIEEGGVRLYADESNAAALKAAARGSSLAAYLRAHIDRIETGDYFAVLGYIAMNEADEVALQAIRHAVRDRTGAATCLGFGPRFLHSTGQAYKGGPDLSETRARP